MELHLLGPCLSLAIGMGIAIGCGGSTTSGAMTAPDSGTDAATPPPPPDPSTTNPGADGGSDANDKDAHVPGTSVPVQYGSCASFSPCGGDPKGTWTYSGGCLDALDLSSCPNATITNPDVKVKGQVTFSGSTTGTVARLVEISTSATLGIPQSCVNAIPIPALQTCAGLQAALQLPPPQGAGFDTATCTAAAGPNGGCDCQVAKTTVEDSAGTFTANGNVITTGNGQTYSYCVSPASTLTYQEATQAATSATFVLTK